MLIKKNQTQKFENSPECSVFEYSLPSEFFSFARAFINGRYPQKKRVINEECEEVYYVVSWEAIIHSEKWDFEINEWDLYFFEKGEIYWVEGKQLSLILVNAPKWYLEQHKIVD